VAAIMAGTGIALILMGALPSAPPVPSSASVLLDGDEIAAPLHTPERKPARTPEGTSARPTPKTAARIAGPSLRASVPLSLSIPTIGVQTKVMSLGLKRDGTVALPPLKGNAPAGWYKYLSTPGEPGPAVILGHVDSAKDGPAVFYRLRELRAGDQLSVGRADGSSAFFTVRSVARYPKDRFPADAVYGPVSSPELRLVTCGGSFDAVRHRYRDNIVVYASLTGGSPARKTAVRAPAT
jgi:sortase (surface protein transpeptidase)